MNSKDKQALSRCMAICSKAEKCIFDIRKKLTEWEIDASASQEIINLLIQEKFIDEERFARYYARDKFRFNQWGRAKINFQLKMKGITATTIEHSLDTIDPDEYQALLIKLLQDKIRKTKFKNEYDRRAKLMNFARSKGFEFELIATTIDKLV